MTVKTSRKDAGVVEDYEVVWAEESGKFAKLAILKSPGRGGNMKETGSGAIRERLLGNQFRRQFEVKIGDEHAVRL